MNPLKPALFVLLLSASLLAAVQASAKTILPDACGDNKDEFDVTTKKDQPPPAPPAEGKAQIVFVEDQNARATFSYLTARYGLDGKWVGANYGNSYFALTVDPGIHHLCVSVQGDKHMIEVASFTAEPGSVYYFDAKVKIIGGSGGGFIIGGSGGGFASPAAGPGVTSGGGSFISGSPGAKDFGFVQLSEDEGKYRVKAWKLATWKPYKPDN